MAKFYAFMWRLNYAGRVMQVMRVPFKDAWRQASEAQYVYSDWATFRPRTLADKRMAMWRK